MYQSRAHQIVLLLDCCYSGAFTRALIHRAGEKIHFDDLAGRGRAILTASSAMEYAFEISGPEIQGVGEPSIFTRTIVHGLRSGEADGDGDGIISVEDLYDHVLVQIRQITPKQTPCKLIDTQGSIPIARSVKGAFGLGKLSSELRRALSSPLPGVRKGVIEELQPLLNAEDESLQRGALAALTQLRSDESDRVAAAAATALGVSPAWLDVRVYPPIDTSGKTSAPSHAGEERDHAGEKHQAAQPAPAQEVSPAAMAQWVDQKLFSTTLRRPGYDEGEVDVFLDTIRDTFLGKRMPPLTSDEVRNIQFSTTRNRPGYDEEEVDSFLDEVEIKLAAWPRPTA